jgi:hypothetical protein
MKSIFTSLILLFSLLSLNISGQTVKKIEFRKANKDKSVFLKAGKNITVVTKMVTYSKDTFEHNFDYEIMFRNPPTRFEKDRTKFYGRLSELNDSFLIISCDLQTTSIEFKQDSSLNIEREYYKKPIEVKIPIDNIDYIDYDGKGSKLFMTGMITSYVTLFVLAPLISYKYGSGTFNGELYIDIVKYSALATFLSEIPYMLTTPKSCKIKTTANSSRASIGADH